MSARRAALVVSALVIALLAGCAGQSTPSTGQPVRGGTATFALPANTTPNYIFPFMGTEYFSVVNVSNLQYHLYRPMYWFGDNGQPVLNDRLSLADQPTFADDNRTVTVRLRDYAWSDGTKVSADNVVFWMNMMKAQKVNWGAYVPGGIPDDIVSVTADSPTQVTFRLNQSYSAKWFTYNELSQITPMPKAWDRTATGPADCSHRISDCAAVYEYLTEQAKSLNDYATNPLWQVVDGPWKLKYFNADGNISFVPNPSYSGPNKPKLDQFDEAPFSDNAAEYNVLRSGDNSIQVGYLPLENAPVIPDGQVVGHNPLSSNYTLDRWYSLSVNYFVLNSNNATAGPIFRQQYFRQALESLVDQRSIIKAAVHGYGTPTTGPVPISPPNPYANAQTEPNPFAYNPDRARTLLADHGWSTPFDGVGVCQRPGTGPDQCGPGIDAGARLQFRMMYATGKPQVSLAMQQVQSSSAKIGLKIDLQGAPFNTVIGTSIPCETGKPDCEWQMNNWGAGWVFNPGFYPTGEQIFGTGAGSNQGSFSDPKLDELLAAAQRSDSPDAMTAYARYGSITLPAIWQPNYDYQATEIANNLKGVTPQNPYLSITPEDWYYIR
ncbi:ABC transporter substrate-binding protein [Pseudonocardia spinosispora]|uniref:ABC transporter substrate-binding protein n=1 Tax=Pseudonocardia spinosispora TaxID=103441 RepID=UPI000A013D98|nr:ABC transporter substrate-binding protein [Pseudonocardia spinosispora]